MLHVPSRPIRVLSAAAHLPRLRESVASGANVFAELMVAARVCSLGQITDTFFEVGGQYRRNV
jgi:methylmalonyl-CoA mutase